MDTKGSWQHVCYGSEKKVFGPEWVYCPTCGDMADKSGRDGRLLGIDVRMVEIEQEALSNPNKEVFAAFIPLDGFYHKKLLKAVRDGADEATMGDILVRRTSIGIRTFRCVRDEVA